MKRVIQTAVVGIFLAAAQNAFAASSFPAAAEANVGQPALSTYADAHLRRGDMLGSAGSPFPIAADVDISKWTIDPRVSA